MSRNTSSKSFRPVSMFIVVRMSLNKWLGVVLRPAQAGAGAGCGRTPLGTTGSVAHMSAGVGQREQAQRLCWLTSFHLLRQVGAGLAEGARQSAQDPYELKMISRLGDCSPG